jgi:LCP family protein required for cell wall assembly
MSKKQFSDSGVKKGYYGYSSESKNISSGKSNKSGKSSTSKLRNSSILGAVIAVIQLIVSIAFVGLVLYKNLAFVTAPILAGVIAVLVLLLAIVFSMEQRGSLGVKRAGKAISILVIAILLALIYLIAPISQMSGKKVSTDPFVVFVSANDTFGEMSDDSNGRSDTNILAVVNPKTYTVLMISTPRDYYVAVQAESVAPNSYDKLTHVGLYGNGIAYDSQGNNLTASDWYWAEEVNWHSGNEALMDTLQALYKFDISEDNYHYVKLNFTGFSELIDALGGITVDVDTAFTTKTYASYGDVDTGERKTYTYTEGEMKMDGATALTYARERHSFGSGDLQRNKNQVKVLKAMSDKLLSAKTLLNYNSIVSSIENSFSTDMDISSMVSLQTQIAGNKNHDGWNILSYSTVGQSSSEILTWNGLSKSVVLQDEESVSNATTLINMVLNGDASETVSNKIEEYNQ